MRDRPYKPDIVRVEEMGDWHRAGGDCICDICGHKLYDHQPVPGYAWLRKLCDGDLVKL